MLPRAVGHQRLRHLCAALRIPGQRRHRLSGCPSDVLKQLDGRGFPAGERGSESPSSRWAGLPSPPRPVPGRVRSPPTPSPPRRRPPRPWRPSRPWPATPCPRHGRPPAAGHRRLRPVGSGQRRVVDRHAEPAQWRIRDPGRLRPRRLRCSRWKNSRRPGPGQSGVLGPSAGSGVSNGDYRRARKQALGLWRAGKPKPAALYAAVAAAAGQQAAWRRPRSDGERPHLPADLAGTEGAFGQFCSELQALAAGRARTSMARLSHPELQARLQALLARRADPLQAARTVPAAHRATWRGPVAAWWRRSPTGTSAVDQALACLEHVWLSSILDTVSIADPRIGAFDGQAHRSTVTEFKAADRAHITSTAPAGAPGRGRERHPHPGRSTRRNPTSSSTRPASKRGHLPVRQLFQAAPHVLGALKPCWAMSPLVVSQLLPAQQLLRRRHLRRSLPGHPRRRHRSADARRPRGRRR